MLNIIISTFRLLLLFILIVGCKNTTDSNQKVVPVEKEKPLVNESVEHILKDSILSYYMDIGLLITVNEKNIDVVKQTDNKNIGSNSNIISYSDENQYCISDGFLDIIHKDVYFTIEQQNCSGWSFIDEYITFKYTEAEDEILLHKFGLIYLDRREPNKLIPQKIFTPKDFGRIHFNDVHLDSLYLLLRN